MYDRNGRRLSRPIKVAIVGGVIGGAIGGSRWGTKGAVLGGVAGAAPGLIAWAFSKGDDDKEEMVVDLPDQIPPMPQTPQASSGRENGWNQRLRNQQTSGAYQRGQVGGRPVNNRTGLDVVLWVGNSEVPLLIARGGHQQVPRNPGGMEAETVETARGGNEVRRPALVVPNHDLDGWDIIVPAGR